MASSDGAQRPPQSNPGGQPRRPRKPGSEAPAGTAGTGDAICPTCRGSGRTQGDRCPDCAGTGVVTQGIGGA